jgi:hypothetical protein
MVWLSIAIERRSRHLRLSDDSGKLRKPRELYSGGALYDDAILNEEILQFLQLKYFPHDIAATHNSPSRVYKNERCGRYEVCAMNNCVLYSAIGRTDHSLKVAALGVILRPVHTATVSPHMHGFS